MKKKIRDSYEKVIIPDYVEKNILKKTVDSKSSIKNYKLAFTVGIIVLFVVFIGGVNAENIESLLARIFDYGAVVDKDGNRYQIYEEVKGVKFKDLSGWPVDEYFETTIEKVEDKLDVKLLKYDEATSDEVDCELISNQVWDSENKGRVERVYLRWLDFYRPKEYGYSDAVGIDYGFSMSIKMVSNKVEESTVMAYLDEMNVMAGKEIIDEYHSDNLDTDVLVYKFTCDYEGCEDREYDEIYTMFVYKNIRYELSGLFKKGNIPTDKLKEIIENLHE